MLPIEIAFTIFEYLEAKELLNVQLTCRKYFAKARELLLKKNKKLFIKVPPNLIVFHSTPDTYRFQKDGEYTAWYSCGWESEFFISVPFSKVLEGWKIVFSYRDCYPMPLNVKEVSLYSLPISNESPTPNEENTFKILYRIGYSKIKLGFGRIKLIYYGYTSLSEDEFWKWNDKETIPWENFHGEKKHEGVINPKFLPKHRYQYEEEMLWVIVPVPLNKNLLFRIVHNPLQESPVYFGKVQ